MATAESFSVPGSTRFRKHEHETAHVCVVLGGGFLEKEKKSWRDVGAGTVRVSGARRHDIDFSRDGARCVVIEADTVASRTAATHFFEFDRRLIALARGIDRLDGSTDSSRGLQRDYLTLEFLAQLDRRLRGRIAPPPPWLERAKELLHDTNGAVSVADIATSAGVHRVHVARTFRDHYGMPVTAYARKLRLERALTLLASSSLPLSRLAAESGFADQSHFTRELRAAIGQTPGAIRSSLTATLPLPPVARPNRAKDSR